MGQLSSKVALISGGASGIGAASAKAIVAEGGKVVIGDLADGPGRDLAAALGEAALFVHLDVTSEADWKRAVDVAVEEFGALNVLVNNAGTVDGGPLGTFTLQQWQKIHSVNLTGAFLGISACVEALKRAAPASIVNISSVAGLQGTAQYYAYSASKWGLRGLTKSAALELAEYGIRVNSVHPGTIVTPMTAGIPESMADNCAMRRFGRPEEIANMVVFVASDLSSFSTGSEFVADGGESAGPVPGL